MEAIHNLVAVAQQYISSVSPTGIFATSLVAVFFAFFFISSHGRRGTKNDEPPILPNWRGIPVLGNTIQYLTDNASLISRAR